MGDVVENKTCADWLTALNEPHEFNKAPRAVTKENRHEEIGERAMAALNSYG